MKIIIHLSFLLFFHQCSQVDIFAHGNYLLSNFEFDILVKNDTKFMNSDKLRMKRKSRNETHKLYGSFELFQGITEDIQTKIEVYAKQGGEYRKTAYHLKGPICSVVIETDLVVYPSLSAASGMSRKCPVAAGTYELLDGWFPDVTKFPPVLVSGDYMTEVRYLSKDGELLQGWKIYGHVINIQGGRIGLK